MSTALAERVDAPAVTADQLALIQRTVANGATADELKLYLYDCARQGVHPLDKLIHFTKRKGKYTPITSIDFMRTRAADTGEYAGSDDATFAMDAQKLVSASVTVWRMVQGQRCPFTATARWSEYKPAENDFMWQKMPHTMLAKCAEALALRKGFPRQLAGLYAKEEMDQAGTVDTHEPARLVVSAPAPVALVGAPAEPSPSVPNGGELGPSIIDTESGEQLPEPPQGFHYVTDYQFKSPWHEATILRWDLQGGSLKVSTKRPTIGDRLMKACNENIPVSVDVTHKAKYPGEAYVNAVELWHGEPEAPAAEGWGADHLEPLTDRDIPF